MRAIFWVIASLMVAMAAQADVIRPPQSQGILITGGTPDAQKIVWDTGNSRFDFNNGALKTGTVTEIAVPTSLGDFLPSAEGSLKFGNPSGSGIALSLAARSGAGQPFRIYGLIPTTDSGITNPAINFIAARDDWSTITTERTRLFGWFNQNSNVGYIDTDTTWRLGPAGGEHAIFGPTAAFFPNPLRLAGASTVHGAINTVTASTAPKVFWYNLISSTANFGMGINSQNMITFGTTSGLDTWASEVMNIATGGVLVNKPLTVTDSTATLNLAGSASTGRSTLEFYEGGTRRGYLSLFASSYPVSALRNEIWMNLDTASGTTEFNIGVPGILDTWASFGSTATTFSKPVTQKIPGITTMKVHSDTNTASNARFVLQRGTSTEGNDIYTDYIFNTENGIFEIIPSGTAGTTLNDVALEILDTGRVTVGPDGVATNGLLVKGTGVRLQNTTPLPTQNVSVDIFGSNTGTSPAATSGSNARIGLYAQDATNGNFSVIEGIDANGSNTSAAIAFVNDNHATNVGSLHFLTRNTGSLFETGSVSGAGAWTVGPASGLTSSHDIRSGQAGGIPLKVTNYAVDASLIQFVGSSGTLGYVGAGTGAAMSVYSSTSSGPIFKVTDGTGVLVAGPASASINHEFNGTATFTRSGGTRYDVTVSNTSSNTNAAAAWLITTNGGSAYFAKAGLQGGWCYAADNVCVVNESGGAYMVPGGTSWVAVSDMRHKTKVADLSPVLDKLMDLSTFTYQTNESLLEDAETAPIEIGMSAQEMLTVAPNVVTGSEDTTYGISYDRLSVVAIKAIQESVSEYRTEIASLREQNYCLANADTKEQRLACF